MKRIWAVALAGLAMAAARPAAADEWGWRHRHYWGPPAVVYSYGPPMVVYAPPPAVVYAPPPGVVYAPPAPVAMQATPTSPPFTDPSGRYCREYQSTVMVGGQPQQSYGTACQQPDGSWRVVN